MLRLQAPLPDRYTLATPDELDAWIAAAKASLGERVLILGHHYQRDEVIKWADIRGDSFKLARFAADNHAATDIVFCGVHFMAESADVLTGDHQRVILPDLNAGCSMADMADIDQVEECWDALADVTDISQVVPITYMNSSAALKAFVGEHGGAVCTSSNARAVLDWALAKGSKVLFFPDQHLGRNTGFDMGYGEADMRVWNPRFELGGLEERDVKEATLLLWKGHCSVHQRFRPEHVAAFRAEHPDSQVIVHPECAHDVVELADKVGSTERILDWVEAAPAGSAIRRRHRDPHGAAHGQRAPRRDRRVARSAHLPVLHDVPHRWPASRLGARVARPGRGRQPDHRRPADHRVGPGCVAEDARHHVSARRHSAGAPRSCAWR